MAEGVNWNAYFDKIKTVCPWSNTAWGKHLIDIKPWKGIVLELEPFHARVYTTDLNRRRLKKLCKTLDHGVYEWLWSEPTYGPYATPVSVLIQQDRQQLNNIRDKL